MSFMYIDAKTEHHTHDGFIQKTKENRSSSKCDKANANERSPDGANLINRASETHDEISKAHVGELDGA